MFKTLKTIIKHKRKYPNEKKSDSNTVSLDTLTGDKKSPFTMKRIILIVLIVLVFAGGLTFVIKKAKQQQAIRDYQTSVYNRADHYLNRLTNDKNLAFDTQYYSMKKLGSWQINREIKDSTINQLQLNKYSDWGHVNFGSDETMLYAYRMPYSKKIALIEFAGDGSLCRYEIINSRNFDPGYFKLEERLFAEMSKYDAGADNANTVNQLKIQFMKANGVQ